MQIDDRLIRYSEELSYISLSDEDRTSVAAGIQRIMSKISILQSLDTDGVIELTHPLGNVNVMREDIVAESLDRALLLKNARQKNEEMFIAPKTVE